MKMSGNTILVTGGGSGIGRGLAEGFLALGNRVVIAGRRDEVLKHVCAENPGMAYKVLDVDDGAAIKSFAVDLVAEFPELNVVVNGAGIMRAESLRNGDLADAEATITTNLLGPMRLTAALLPALLSRREAVVMTVSSGLAFVPRASTPTYSTTKAAIHSYSQSLRYQLRDTAVKVIEIIPPYVRTELMGSAQATDPRAMPLGEFITETMGILGKEPEATEICVERVKPLRFAEVNGDYGAFFTRFNDAIPTTK